MQGSLGSILGPLLFLIYINDLPNSLKSTVLCLYADDLQIFIPSYDSVGYVKNLNSDLGNITDWLNVNKLQSHSSKTKLMVIGSRINLNSKVGNLRWSVTMNNKTLTSVTSHKCLGIDLDERLAFDVYTKELCKKNMFQYWCLVENKTFRLTRFASDKSLVQLYFDYCNKRLKSTNYDASPSTLLQKLNLDTLNVLLYKVLCGLSAPCLTDNFIRLWDLESYYHLRNYDIDLKLPKPKTNFVKRCFNYSASSLWNSLPSEAKKATSVSHFRRWLQAFHWICNI